MAASCTYHLPTIEQEQQEQQQQEQQEQLNNNNNKNRKMTIFQLTPPFSPNPLPSILPVVVNS